MQTSAVSKVWIDSEGRLHLAPSGCEFPYIYREAMEVNWDPSTRSLFSPTPREWTYAQWFKQLLAAAREQGQILVPDSSTDWTEIPADIKDQCLQAATGVA